MSENTDKNRDKRLDNLEPTKWKPGESGNPAGRPKGRRDYATVYKEALMKLAELNGKTPDELEVELLTNAIINARKGDYRFYKDVVDRMYGSAQQNIDVMSAGDKLETNVIVFKNFDGTDRKQ